MDLQRCAPISIGIEYGDDEEAGLRQRRHCLAGYTYK